MCVAWDAPGCIIEGRCYQCILHLLEVPMGTQCRPAWCHHQTSGRQHMALAASRLLSWQSRALRRLIIAGMKVQPGSGTTAAAVAMTCVLLLESKGRTWQVRSVLVGSKGLQGRTSGCGSLSPAARKGTNGSFSSFGTWVGFAHCNYSQLAERQSWFSPPCSLRAG